MATPSNINLPQTEAQVSGFLIPEGALRLPPPVGLQAEVVCGAGGGLCLWGIGEAICYIGAAGIAICTSAVVVPICVVVGGVAVCYTISQIFENINRLETAIYIQRLECDKLDPNLHPELVPAGADPAAAVGAHVRCLEYLQKLIDELKFWDWLLRQPTKPSRGPLPIGTSRQ